MVIPCSSPEVELFIHQSRWKPKSTLFPSKIWKMSFVYLFIYLFLQLIFTECPLIFTLSSWSRKGNGQREGRVRIKKLADIWTQKVGLGPRECTEHKNGILRGDLEHHWANRVTKCLNCTFVLPTCFRVSEANPPLWLAETPGLCIQRQLAGCHHTYINLLASLLHHPFPWEALSSHMSSARKVTVDTSVCVSGWGW